MNTHVYVDAFNLYFGCLKDSPFKWLNISELCRHLLSGHQIQSIKYFTARVNARPSDPDQPARQQTYIRALQTVPEIKVIYGHFLSHEVSMPLALPNKGGPKYVRVLKTEEKGSDVNLATHLLADGFKNLYDCAVIISNDSDLLAPLVVAKNDLKKTVGILNPHPIPARVLYRNATFVKPIRQGVLRISQFPKSMRDTRGTFNKPASW